MTLNILSIGECMGELSEAGENLLRFGFAGDTLNTAWYLRALLPEAQFTVDYFTAVGRDKISDDMLKFLAVNGLGIDKIRRIPERTIGLYLISLAGAERSFTYWRDSSAARLLAHDGEHLRAAIRAAGCIYFSGITLAILPPGDRQNLLAELAAARRSGKTVAFDSNIRMRLWHSQSELAESLEAAYRVATIALPTFDDDSMVFGDRSANDCARRIAGYGVSEVVVKCGAGPCLVLSADSSVMVEPQPVATIVDTTGAGDSFGAGYIAARLAGCNPQAAARMAHRVAGEVIGHRGALVDMARFAKLPVG